MRRFYAYGLAIAFLAACSTQEKDFQTPQQEDVIYYASFEQPTEEGTRVYANEDLLLRWTADDRVSIFGKNTLNQQYKFLGETGDNSGGFSKVDGAEYVTGNPISHTVSVYPYQASTKITEDEVLTVTLPAEQHYAENTFGLGTNTMVSVSSDNFLQYKNVGGYLMLKLYGEGVSVSSITLKGNNGEKLAGKATVTMPLDGVPVVVMADDAATKITLVCDAPVALGATSEESTEFWFVVPPETFCQGFTITVKASSGGTLEKSTDKSITIERSKLSKMSPMAVDISIQPTNVIFYESTDGQTITPYNPNAFGANIVSNEYVDGRGIITFDGDVTFIDDYAFYRCSGLTSVGIPSLVKYIGNRAFNECSGLTSIVVNPGNSTYDSRENCNAIIKTSSNTLIVGCKNTIIPNSVTSIGTEAFYYCSGLTSIEIPNSVMYIESAAFFGCSGLTSIEIPNSVKRIDYSVFASCSRLTSIVVNPDNSTYDSRENCNAIIKTDNNALIVGCKNTIIPNSVIGIGYTSFEGCSELTSIVIPNSVTYIDSNSFLGCEGLTSIVIPNSVTYIGNRAFNYCTALSSIEIPASVTDIDSGAFDNCTGLSSIFVRAATPPTIGSSVFNGTNNCPIYVPAPSVEAYKSANGWSDYADRIQVIPIPVPEAIDLGLPSGLKWASFNLGASSPQEIGNLYRWGETEPRQGYEDPYTNPMEFYKWSVGIKYGMNTFYYLTKYCQNSEYGYNGFKDNKTILEPEDDAAYFNLGGKWRMPTDEEWSELLNNCSWEYISETGGRTVTGPNGNSIFFPSISKVRITGWFWTSNLDTNDFTSGSAWCAYFDDTIYQGLGEQLRTNRYSIRPVCE